MAYVLVRSGAEEWRVEGINHDSEGEISLVTFSGWNAEELARDYFRSVRGLTVV